MITDLHSLVAPNPLASLTDAIVAEHRLHLHTTRQADFARLLPWSAFNGLLTLDRLRGGQVRAIRDGSDMPLGMLTARSGRFANQELEEDMLQSLADMA